MTAAMLGLSIVFGLIILIKAGGLLVTSARAGVLVRQAAEQGNVEEVRQFVGVTARA